MAQGDQSIKLESLLQPLADISAQLGYKLVSKQNLNNLISTCDDFNFIKKVDSKYQNECLKLLECSRAQFRQDLFVLSQLDFKKNGFFVEFGAADGLVSSNSYLLEKNFNWRGILAEPATFWHDALMKNRTVYVETKCVWKSSKEEILFNETDNLKQLSTINSFSNSDSNYNLRELGNRYLVETISLVDLLNKYNAPPLIDYLSIDTEGSEFDILSSFDFDKYKFKVITCEHNFSESRDKIHSLLQSKGYTRKFTTISKVDDWYLLAD